MAQVPEINPVILNAKQLVYHGLVSPLVEQWRDWVLPSVQYQHRGIARLAVTAHLLDELSVVEEPVVKFLSEHLAYFGAFIVADARVLGAQRHESGVQAVRHAEERRVVDL